MWDVLSIDKKKDPHNIQESAGNIAGVPSGQHHSDKLGH